MEAALLRAVIEGPDDDAPRLSYAQWCDRNADPRGEFIRLQLEAARASAVVDSPREQELLARHGDGWARPLPGAATAWRFRRGFVEWVEAEAAAWLANAESWLRLFPISQLRLRTPQPVLERLCADEHLLRIRALYLTDCRFQDADVAVLASSPCLRKLELLELSFNLIGALGAEALVASPNLQSLKRLGFEGNRVELLQRRCRDWDGSVQSVEVPELLLQLVKKHGARPWLSEPVG